MRDCSKDVIKYHNEIVTLPPPTRSNIRGNRNANRDRMKRGLRKNDKPQPDEFIIQGSYAMKTMKQHPENNYDIDDGAAFALDKLIDKEGTPMTPRQAKEMVRDALIEGGGLKEDPKVKKNCVRVDYAAGHHVDIPVYRVTTDGVENQMMELAGETWRASDPQAITEWFRSEEQRTVSEDEDEPQLRRLLRLLKMYAKIHLGNNSLSGLILTVLAAEKYTYHDSKEDRAFRNLITDIKNRLTLNKRVFNPTDRSEELTKEEDDDKCQKLIDQVEKTLGEMEGLDDPECSKLEARKIWDSIFKTDFFSNLQKKEKEEQEPYSPSDSYPNKAVNIHGPGTAA